MYQYDKMQEMDGYGVVQHFYFLFFNVNYIKFQSIQKEMYFISMHWKVIKLNAVKESYVIDGWMDG